MKSTSRRARWILAGGISLLLAVVVFWPRSTADFGSGADGRILNSYGAPIAGADVTIYFEETVFDAITPMRVAQMKSAADGSFGEHFISCGRPGGRYRVVVKKEGYWPRVVAGTGLGNHRITLRYRGAV